MAPRRFDVALLGSTGFTGQRTASELGALMAPGQKLALVGRDRTRLDAVAAKIPRQLLEIVVADSTSLEAMRALARDARVIATTVGPYLKYGLPLVQACAEAGTHLCDITGEVLYMRDCIDRFDAVAKASGARIVTSCGFDSVPSDLGLFALHQHLLGLPGNPALSRATLVVESLRGGYSGGTLASFLATLDAARADRARRAILMDPWALSPDRAREPDLGPQRELLKVEFDAFVDRWTAPFVMASVNTRVVRRSNALLGHAYGPRLRYREVVGLKRGPLGLARGAAVAFGLGAVLRALTSPRLRPLLEPRLHRPGAGPSDAQIRTGRMRLRIVAETEDGRRFEVVVTGEGDPGYGITPVILAQAAISLAEDGDRLPARAGVLTPAAAFEATLLARLRARGLGFEVRAT